MNWHLQKLNRLGKERVLFLMIILFLIIAPIFMRSSYAHLNNNRDSRLEKVERAPSRYKFIKVPGRHESNYGTHDWIADAALLVIKSSAYYAQNKRILDWLLDPLDRLKWATLDKIKGVNQFNPWFSMTQWRNTGLTNELWLKARRKAWFLFGTMRPDLSKGTNKQVTNIRIYLPTEEFVMKGKYLNSGGKHYVYVDNTGKVDLNNAPEARFAMKAARDAIDYLNKLHTLKSKKTGQNYDLYGSYEPGAFALGMVAHFVSDLGSSPHTIPKFMFTVMHPSHTQDDQKWAHYTWERFTDAQMDPEFSVQHNGPTTNIINRGDLFTMSFDLSAGGKRPDIAAKDLARYTRNVDGDNFGGTYEYDPLYYSQHPFDEEASEKLIYERVVKYTLKRAVLETANAILWVLLRVDWDKHGNTDDYDTVGRLSEDFIPAENEALQHDPVPASEIPNTMQGYTQFNPPKTETTLSASAVSMLVVLAPLIAIALIPPAEKIIQQIVKNK